MNIPNLLTLCRILLVPVVLVLLFRAGQAGSTLACVLFVIAALTDWFDGYLARRWNQTSAIGAFLDPVADKLMVCSVLVALACLDGGLTLALCTIIIVAREIAVSALREVMAGLGQRAVVAVGS